MKVQNKEAESTVGSGALEDEWQEGTHEYRVRKKHLELLRLIPSRGLRILDAGCGPGTYGIMLAQEGNTVVGVEISPSAVRIAKGRADRKDVKFCPVVGDLEEIPFDDNTFDICFSGWVLHHFPDVDTVISEISRVLKPGAKLALAEPNESNPAVRFSRFVENLPLLRRWVLDSEWDSPNRSSHKHGDYVLAMKRHGFEDVEVRSCFPGGVPPLPPLSQGRGISLVLVHLMARLRRQFFIGAARVLPRPLNGADLLIIGIKGAET
jgi:ubiquinone/menaquinone biosynthesis C-methylase UbiE